MKSTCLVAFKIKPGPKGLSANSNNKSQRVSPIEIRPETSHNKEEEILINSKNSNDNEFRVVEDLFTKLANLLVESCSDSIKLIKLSKLKDEFIVKFKQIRFNKLSLSSKTPSSQNFFQESDRMFLNFKQKLSVTSGKMNSNSANRYANQKDFNLCASYKLSPKTEQSSDKKQIITPRIKSLSKDMSVLNSYLSKAPTKNLKHISEANRGINKTHSYHNINTKQSHHRSNSSKTSKAPIVQVFSKELANQGKDFKSLHKIKQLLKHNWTKHQSQGKSSSISEMQLNQIKNTSKNFHSNFNSGNSSIVMKPGTAKDNILNNKEDASQILPDNKVVSNEEIMSKLKVSLSDKYSRYLDFSYNDFCMNSKTHTINSHHD